MQITLAPIPFYWPKAQVFDFYQQALHWPVDRICLGETICAKRRELRLDDWLVVAQMLQQQGKTPILSTLALVQSAADLKTLKAYCQNTEFELEVNDLAGVELCHQLGRPFSAGPFLNIYNSATLKRLYQDGLLRWNLPVELGKAALADLLEAIEQAALVIKTELLVHGFLPLALSARCFTARATERPKDQCERICLDYPRGIRVTSSDQQTLFTINGLQTLSGHVFDLLSELDDIRHAGIDSIRISPSQPDMATVVHNYAVASRGQSLTAAQKTTARPCNGFWFGKPGMIHVE